MYKLDYDVVIRSLLPDGSVWEPKEFELGTVPGVELITNGDFASDLSSWTDLDTSVPGSYTGDSSWDAGELKLTFNFA